MTVFPDILTFEDAGIQRGTRVFRLAGRFRYRSSLGTIEVPAGTLTDGASIPRLFWPVLDPLGPYFQAAVIHDFLYSPANHAYTRLQADFLFKEAMYNSQLDWPRRELIYRAVRLFGESRFRGTRP